MAGVTWRQLWRETSDRLAEPVETRWLLEDVSGLDAARLLGDLDGEAPPQAVARLDSLVARRVSGEPLQHVLGHWSFRTLDVRVVGRVLVPRPETELVVEVALSQLDRIGELRGATELLAVDLGTGSGVIALSIVAERSAVGVIATDSDPGALELAAANLARTEARAASRVRLVLGDWYGALPVDLAGAIDLIVANPPYLAEHEWPGLDPVVSGFDPYGALVAGPSGLEAVTAVVAGAPMWLGEDGAVVVEIAPHQAGAALELARNAGFAWAKVEDDLAGRERVLVAGR